MQQERKKSLQKDPLTETSTLAYFDYKVPVLTKTTSKCKLIDDKQEWKQSTREPLCGPNVLKRFTIKYINVTRHKAVRIISSSFSPLPLLFLFLSLESGHLTHWTQVSEHKTHTHIFVSVDHIHTRVTTC